MRWGLVEASSEETATVCCGGGVKQKRIWQAVKMKNFFFLVSRMESD